MHRCNALLKGPGKQTLEKCPTNQRKKFRKLNIVNFGGMQPHIWPELGGQGGWGVRGQRVGQKEASERGCGVRGQG